MSEVDDWVSVIGWFSCVRDWWLGFSDWLIELCHILMIFLQWWVIVWLLILRLSFDNGSITKIWWNVAYNLWCVEASGSSVKIYKTWSMDDAEGWSLQWGSWSFLLVVAGDQNSGLELPSSSSWRTSEGCSLLQVGAYVLVQVYASTRTRELELHSSRCWMTNEGCSLLQVGVCVLVWVCTSTRL